MQSQVIIALLLIWINYCCSQGSSYSDRMVSVGVTMDNIITTYAGSGSYAFTGDGGAATSAGLDGPLGISFDTSGNSNIYVNKLAYNQLFSL